MDSKGNSSNGTDTTDRKTRVSSLWSRAEQTALTGRFHRIQP